MDPTTFLAKLRSARMRLAARRSAVIGRRDPQLDDRRESAWVHVLLAVGGPVDVARRSRRMAQAGWRLAEYRTIEGRLERLATRGDIPSVPTRAQLLFGGLDMIRFLFEPGSRKNDVARGISPRLHRVLRTASDPASWIDPGGVTTDLERLLDHITEEFHFSPQYDLELLDVFEDGLQALAERCAAIREDRHPRAATARARVPGEDYHRGLEAYARARLDGEVPDFPRFRSNDSDQGPLLPPEALPSFFAAAAQLSTLHGFLAYCAGLPTDPAELVRRFRHLHRFPIPEDPTL